MKADNRFARLRPLALLAATVALAILLVGGEPAEAAFPGANGKIVFTGFDGDAEIFVMEPDGSGVTQLTFNGAGDAQASWSADGTKIAFASARDGDAEIFVMNADGSGQTQLTQNGIPDVYPAWSPDGTKITFTRFADLLAGDVEIFVMNADGSGQTQLTSDGLGKRGSEWSPDGTKIAFARGRADGGAGIVVMNANGSGETDISPASFASDFDPSWSPDGAKIAFWDGSGGGILTMNADGSGRTTLATGNAHEPVWSPDGTKIAFVRPNSNFVGGSVRTINADGSGEQTLVSTVGSGFLLRPDWQPLAGASDFDWSMPDRYGADDDGDGLIDSFQPDGSLLVDPAGFQVDFAGSGDACGGTGVSKTAWVIEGMDVTAGDANVVAGDPASCTFSYRFPEEGSYEVTLEGRAESGKDIVSVTQVVPVQDFLVVSIGDSVASGEGNPDVTKAGAPPRWQSKQCHRSALAGPARSARAIEQDDTRTSVTFVHLACSGATVDEGLLGPYKGIESGPKLPPQVDQLADLVGDREIDGVLVSIGANDVKFSSLIKRCFLLVDCQVIDPASAAGVFEREIVRLPGRYDDLDRALQPPQVSPDRIYLTEYFDPTRDSTGALCSDILADHPAGGGAFGGAFEITVDEARWASENMLVRLNAELLAATVRHGWRYTGGITNQFLPHGYCAPLHWVVTHSESVTFQGDENGTLHPNGPGHGAYASRLADELTADLYAAGNPQSPRRPEQRLEAQGKRASDPAFLDIVEAVAPGETVTIRIRVNGPDNGSRTVSLELDGEGSLSASSATTDDDGEITVTYTAPDPFAKDSDRVIVTFADEAQTFRDTVGIKLAAP